MRNERKHYTAEEKVAILRRHLLDKVPVSDLCEELGLRPTVFCRWQKEFFENGCAAFQSKERPPVRWKRNRNGAQKLLKYSGSDKDHPVTMARFKFPHEKGKNHKSETAHGCAAPDGSSQKIPQVRERT